MSLSLNVLSQLGMMILAGMFMGRMMKHIKLPNVTGYLLAGLLLGPYFLPALGCPFSVLSESFISGIGIISEVALGFIAFSIGNEFRISYFKKVGAAPLIIASMESLFAVVVVVAVLILTRHDVAFSLVLGSIAAATAPAATIMVINQYRAKGPVTSTLLSVVAIDDATALILFSVSTAIASSMAGRGSNPVVSILIPVGQILAALAIGGAMGFLLLIPMRYFKKKGNRLALICGFLFAAIGIADLLGLSSLMLCMALGATVANLSTESEQIISIAESVTSPIYILFFVASGAGLQVSVLKTVGLIGVIYIVGRIIGKLFGAWLGARMSKCEAAVSKYLGPCLLPQAGVAIGLTLLAGQIVPEYAPTIRAVVLAGTLVYEIIGPGITKMSLTKAGEIRS
ncbi:MAG TPA: cation/H(+) antiporter [Lachnospiraceae bacterium]|nr:cation/H(+) antiporter [Lachnospiraceae bacterium]